MGEVLRKARAVRTPDTCSDMSYSAFQTLPLTVVEKKINVHQWTSCLGLAALALRGGRWSSCLGSPARVFLLRKAPHLVQCWGALHVPCYIMSHHISWIYLGASLCRTRSQPHPLVRPTSPWRWETWPSHRTHRNLELGIKLGQEIQPGLITDWVIDTEWHGMTLCDTDIALTLIGSVLYDSQSSIAFL